MREIFEEKKNIFMALGILLAIFLVLSIVSNFSTQKEDYKKIKENDYVYTLQSSKGENNQKSELPVINLNFENVTKYNDDIRNFYYEIIKDEKNQFTYTFTVKDHILFVLLRTDFFAIDNNSVETRFTSFNISLQTGELLQNDEVLDHYGYTEENVEKTIETSMKNYYEEARKKGYIDPNECKFSCYLVNHDINEKNLAGGVSLYIQDEKLVIYRGFTVDTVLGDQKLFEKEDFMFEIKK